MPYILPFRILFIIPYQALQAGDWVLFLEQGAEQANQSCSESGPRWPQPLLKGRAVLSRLFLLSPGFSSSPGIGLKWLISVWLLLETEGSGDDENCLHSRNNLFPFIPLFKAKLNRLCYPLTSPCTFYPTCACP